MRSTVSREHSRRLCLISSLAEIPGTEEEERASAKQSVTKKEFQGKGTSLAPEFIATKLQVVAGSEGTQVTSVPVGGSLLKTRACTSPARLKTGLQPPRLTPLDQQLLSGVKLFFHGLLIRKWKYNVDKKVLRK